MTHSRAAVKDFAKRAEDAKDRITANSQELDKEVNEQRRRAALERRDPKPTRKE